MRLSIPRSDLARLLAATTKVVEARNTIPILSTVRLVADGGKLSATATDLDIEVSASIDCDAEADGSFCVSASLLDSIVKKLPPIQDVLLETEDHTLTVKAGRYKSKLQTLPTQDFPTFSVDGFTSHFDLDLAALLAPVKFAMSNEETRYYLNGVFLHVQDAELRAVATDGHRLARNATPMPDSIDDHFAVILPRKFVGLIPQGSVAVSVSASKVRVVVGDTTITSKLIDGTFPDYQRVIPTKNDKIITFTAGDMRQSVDRVSTLASERARAAKLTFASDVCTLAVTDADNGSATDEIAVGYDGDPVEIGFNGAYLSEALGIAAGDVTLALADGGAPALFRSDANPELLVVIMPMRV